MLDIVFIVAIICIILYLYIVSRRNIEVKIKLEIAAMLITSIAIILSSFFNVHQIAQQNTQFNLSFTSQIEMFKTQSAMQIDQFNKQFEQQAEQYILDNRPSIFVFEWGNYTYSDDVSTITLFL